MIGAATVTDFETVILRNVMTRMPWYLQLRMQGLDALLANEIAAELSRAALS